jgi:hypothetical protein
MAKLKPTIFSVHQSKPFQGKEWRVTGYLEGKRKQFWFKTEKEAKADAEWRNKEREAYGSKIVLNAETRLEASIGQDKLAPYDANLLDAVNHYVDHLKKLKASAPFLEFAAKLRIALRKDFESNELELRNYEKILLTLKKMEKVFGDQIVCEITTDEVRDWIRGLRLKGEEDAAFLAGKTRNVLRGYSNLIFNRAIDMQLTNTNPVLGVKKFREHYNETEEIGVITAEEAETLLRTVDSEAVPFLALWLFTGIRRATIEKMDWSQVPITGRRIKVPRYIGKNRRNRRPYPVNVEPNLIEWLKPYKKEKGSLLALSKAPQSRDEPSKRRTHDLIWDAAEKAGIDLPRNFGRNTFISMHVEKHKQKGWTALLADTSEAIIDRDYLDMVEPEDAKRFWEIYPPWTMDTSKIIPMSQVPPDEDEAVDSTTVGPT